MTADSSSSSSTATISHSGEDFAVAAVAGGSGSVNSPSRRKSLPVPWSQAVRGGTDPDLNSSSPPLSPRVSDPAPVPEGSDNCNAGGAKKSAWNKLSGNGDVEGTTSPVMGAASWPALSESTRPGVKSLPSHSDLSSQQTSDGSAAVYMAPVIPQPPPKQFKPNPNPNPNHLHRHQRPTRRGGGAGGASGGYNRPPPPPPPPMPPPFPVFDVYANLVPQPPLFKGNNNWSPRPVVNVGSDHSANRNPTRRNNNFNPRPNGGRRDHHDRDWRGPRSPQIGPPIPPVRGFIRQPHPGPPPFIPHQPLRPFVAPMGYDMGASYVYVPTLAPEPYRGAPPLLPHGVSGPMFMDPFLLGSILKQIEYYFSDENLLKDYFLRSRMDEEGWVSVTLIAGFHRVKLLTNDIQMIMTSLRDSTSVEIQGDKLRRRTDWRRWINSQGDTTREATDSSVEENPLQKLTLEDEPTNEKTVGVVTNGEVSSDKPCF